MKTIPNRTKATANGEPRARKDDLIVKEMPDEVLIYDLVRDKAHCLNRAAALVWNYCDGRTSAAAMTGRLEQELKVPVDEGVVWLALDQLSKNHLLEENIVPPTLMAGINRRQMIRALGVAAAVAVPVVTSIVAPTPAQAATLGGTGSPCCTGTECASGVCNGAGAGCSPQGTCL
ncbi:MAG: PqqD family protein [Pyrinomonadaceae bacterium]